MTYIMVQFTFNFFNATPATAKGGTSISATVSNFPVLVNNGGSTCSNAANHLP